MICATCPVRSECLADALAHDETVGIWGGTTGDERVQLRVAERHRAERDAYYGTMPQ
jgi:WhiB family redox-sensing transcriptional regulator